MVRVWSGGEGIVEVWVEVVDVVAVVVAAVVPAVGGGGAGAVGGMMMRGRMCCTVGTSIQRTGGVSADWRVWGISGTEMGW